MKVRRDRLVKAEDDLLKKIETDKQTLADRILAKGKYSQLLGRMSLTWEDIPKIELVLNEVERELQEKNNQLVSIKQKIIDLQKNHEELLKKTDKEIEYTQECIDGIMTKLKTLDEKCRARDLSIITNNQKIKENEIESNRQERYKLQLEEEIKILEAELGNKDKAVKNLEQSIVKTSKDANNLEYERESLTQAQTSLFAEKDNLGKNSARKTMGLGLAAICSMAAFTHSFLYNKK